MVSILAPEDRQEGAEAVFETWGGDPRPEPRIVKFCNAEGEIGMYVLRMRSFSMDDFPGSTGYCCLMERVGSTRHLRPGGPAHQPQAPNTSRPVPPTPRATPFPRPYRRPRRHMLIPGVACLSLPPLPPDVDKRPPEAYSIFPGQAHWRRPKLEDDERATAHKKRKLEYGGWVQAKGAAVSSEYQAGGAYQVGPTENQPAGEELPPLKEDDIMLLKQLLGDVSCGADTDTESWRDSYVSCNGSFW